MTPSDAPNLLTRLSEALAGQYRIERTLGQGGMGTVFLGRDETLDRLVAIKVISPDVGTSPEIRQRFIQEARVVARLRHPNIVAVFAAGEAGGLLYFVMEYVSGESLRERLVRQRALTADEAVPILHDLAMALDHAHAAGIVHRDVKPENVLLDGESGRAMLMDFGVARALANDGRLTGTGFVLGSPRYMSPEQASGDDHLDGRSDLYSLGLIAYEMFSGEPAVDAPTAASVLVKHLTERPMPLGQRVADVPEDVAAAIDRLLEKPPDARFQRGAAFAAALNGEAFDDRTPSNQIGRSAPGSRRPSRKRRRRTLIGAGGAAVAVAVAGGAWWTSRSQVNDRSWFIAPFEIQGPDQAQLQWLREGSLNMLTLSLSQWKDLQVTEYERALDLLREEGLDDDARVGLDKASKIARGIGAGRVVMGQITSVGDSIVVTATLYDVRLDRSTDKARVAAVKGSDPRPLFETIASELLDFVGAPSITMELSKQTTTSVAAYRAYLDGLRHLNAWRLVAADSAFNVAIGLDSTFALAYYKKALAMGWIPSFDSTRRIASEKAVANAARLPARLQEIVRGHDELTKAFFATDKGDTAAVRAGFLASRNRIARLVASDSNDAEAWYALADADFHLVTGTKYGMQPDTAAKYFTESLRGFHRTLRLDPTFHLASSHLVQIYAQAASPGSNVILVGDSLRPGGDPAYERRVGSSQQVAALKTAARTRSREAAVAWLAADPDAMPARRELANAYVALRQPDSAVAVLREAARHKDPERAFEWQIPLIMAKHGMPSAGTELLAVMNRYPADSVAKLRLEQRLMSIFAAVTVGGATGMPSLLDRASALLQRTDPTLPGDTIKSKFMMDYYTTGMKVGMGVPMSAGMRATLTTALQALELAPPNRRDISIPYMVYLETRDPLFAEAAQRFANPNLGGLPELQALTAIERGDTTSATRLADAFPSVDSLRSATLAMNGMRLMARAEVMAALGRTRLATEIYESIDPARFGMASNPEPGWPLYVRSYLMRGRLYDQLGDKARAIASYERFLVLWKDAEAPLQPQLREARSAIGRLRDAGVVPVKGAL
jgi:serine/threonine protein kinase/tetratricopeptide (TPR) repeat protein